MVVRGSLVRQSVGQQRWYQPLLPFFSVDDFFVPLKNLCICMVGCFDCAQLSLFLPPTHSSRSGAVQARLKGEEQEAVAAVAVKA